MEQETNRAARTAFQLLGPGAPGRCLRALASGLAIITVVVLLAVAAHSPAAASQADPRALRTALEGVSHRLEEGRFLSPQDHGVYPADFAPPLFLWESSGYDDEQWLVRVGPGPDEVLAVTDEPAWRPSPELWAALADKAGRDWLAVEAVAFSQGRPVVRARTRFMVSPDPFDAKVLVQRIPLPFLYAQDNPTLSRWILADPSSPEPPVTVLSHMPYCGNCHTVSRDGSTLGMDVDFQGDKGGYVLAPMAEDVVVGPDEYITWSAYRPDEPGQSMGLFTKLSADGRYVLTTVKEKSLFIPIDNALFSQLFYPIRGHVAFYDRLTRTMAPLPGADRPDRVQTSPDISPDGAWVVFASVPLDQRLLDAVGDRKFLEAEGRFIGELNDLYPCRFDLYRVPFALGAGGEPEPLAGASADGMSNYFPRFSPDGRWIVYCRAPTGLVLQPDSRLWIVPAQGGESRPLECNTELLNSWHSFTPNGRWLVFSAKELSACTQVFTAHLDEAGRASRPVLLDALYDGEAAYIIPEAVNRDLPLRSVRLVLPSGNQPSGQGESE